MEHLKVHDETNQVLLYFSFQDLTFSLSRRCTVGLAVSDCLRRPKIPKKTKKNGKTQHGGEVPVKTKFGRALTLALTWMEKKSYAATTKKKTPPIPLQN